MRLSPSWFGWLAGLLIALVSPSLAADLKPLVDVQWLRTQIERDDLVILDIRNGIDGGSASTFAQGHIPGSVHSDYLQAGWRTEVDGVVGQVPDAAALEALIGGLGIDNQTTVVVVPGGVSSSDFGSAARVYWTFKYAGHDDVAILDGGYRAWTDTPGHPIETGPSRPEPKGFEVRLRPELRVDSTAVQAALDDDDTALIDARPTAQFTGLKKHREARAAGHIPGALHFDQANTFDRTTGKLIDLERLAALLPSGLQEAETVYSYCNTGHWAAVNWFVLSEVVGKDNVKLYDGSMVDWTRDPERPVEK